MEDVSFFVGYSGFASSVVICSSGRHEQEKQWGVRLERHWLCSSAAFFFFSFGCTGSLLCRCALCSCTERWATLGCGVGASHRSGFSGCSTWAREHRLTSCGAWLSCSPQHRGSSQIRDQTCVPCIGRQILNHWTTRKVPAAPFLTSQHDLGPCCYSDPQCPPGNLVERMM